MEEEPHHLYRPTGSAVSDGALPPQPNSRLGRRGTQSGAGLPPGQDRKGVSRREEGGAKGSKRGRGTQEGSPHNRENGSSSRRAPPGEEKRATGSRDITQRNADAQGGRSQTPDVVHHSKKGPHGSFPGRIQDQVTPGSSGQPEASSGNAHAELGKTPPIRRTRAPKFNPGLTVPAPSTPEETSTHSHTSIPSNDSKPPQTSTRKNRPRPIPSRPVPDDLTSTLTRALSTRPYPDCSICFSAMHPSQPTWSCSPSISQVLPVSGDGSTSIPQYCWTTFHLKCVKSWAEKSVKELEAAWRNRGEMDKKGEWRCPGCQAKREGVPTGYRCFCNSTPDPKPPRLATPHSCGNSCSRSRETECGHACPLLCHPGPCPPCQVTLQIPCPCPRHQVVVFRCGDDSLSGKGKSQEDPASREKVVSCGNVCGRLLDCRKHSCQSMCHTGACDPCELMEVVKCHCGRSSKELGCGVGDSVPCSIRNIEGGDIDHWIGRFQCELTCDRPFDCGIHSCQKFCHPLSPEPATCPFSPSKVTHCPCGKHAIAPQADGSLSSSTGEFAFPSRQSCAAPIPTCNSVCGKIQTLCGHECSAKCHLGSCPSCSVPMARPCRCGVTTREIKCADFITGDGERELLCDRPCTVLRACGKHECRRVCCPLASLAFGKGKKTRAAGVDAHSTGIGEEEGGLHECDLLCGKMLTCGNHTCDKRDHRGPCPSCLRSTFEEVFCPCGRTVLDPPVPCGTKIDCRYQCPRVPSCGHPQMSHTCHEEPPPCPPCAYLTTKQCACGKKEMGNVKCSLEREKVSCAATCGSLLGCGFHRCQKLCHAGDCGACTAQCGKDRKFCLPAHHPCTQPCHAPSACPEDEPCGALVTASCPCGRLKQSLRCGRCFSSPSGTASSYTLKCNSQCELAKRNARLAEALGINEESRERAGRHMAGGPVVYPDEVIAFAKEDPKFVLLVEKTFSEFIASNKRSQVLPHMPQEKRKFVYSLAGIYRLDAQMVDQEPLRSVQVVQRLDSHVPTPLLSTSVTSMPLNPGKAGSSSARHVPSKPGSPAPIPPTTGIGSLGARGWGPIVNPRSNITKSSMASGTTFASGSGRNVASSGSITPDIGAGARNTQSPATKLPEENVDVPDNWEDDV